MTDKKRTTTEGHKCGGILHQSWCECGWYGTPTEKRSYAFAEWRAHRDKFHPAAVKERKELYERIGART